ncbi:restriction endonuclease subunit S [Aeromonas hydrophila]
MTSKNGKQEGWIEVLLEDCVEILDSKRIPVNAGERAKRTEGKSRSELYPYYGATGEAGLIDDFIFEGEHLLIGEDGAPFFDKTKNVAFVVKEKFWVNNHAHILKAFDSVTSNRYLSHYLNQFDYKGFVGGSTRLKLNQASMKKIPVLLPSLSTQHAIVDKIEELYSHIDAGVEGLKQAKAKLQQYRQSVLKDAVTGKLTDQWREQNVDKLEPASSLLNRILDERRANWEAEQLKAFEEKGQTPKNDKWKEKYKVVHPLNDSDLIGLPKLPSGWCYAKLGQIIDEPRYGTSKKCTYESIGKGVLRIPNIAAGVIDAEDMKYAEFSDDEIATYKLNEGDILTIRSNGSVSLVGKCAVIEGKDTDFLYAGYLIRLRPILKYIDSHYLVNILSSVFLRKQIERLAKSSSGINNINAGEIQSLIVPICGLEEQHKIAKEIESKNVVINRQLQDYAKLVKQAENSKASILNKAFSGELVENIYTDGTAVQLLGRIQAEKTQLENKEKLAKKKPTARTKQMKRRPILDVLMESKKALNVDELFDLAGYQSEITPETVEEFYQELKVLTAITGVKVTPVKVGDVKQGDLFEYKEVKPNEA